MRLVCPACGANIDKRDVALHQGIAQCARCNEHFRLASHLRSDEEIRRSVKPLYSKITIEPSGIQRTVRIPPRGWTMGLGAVASFIAIWSCGWVIAAIYECRWEQSFVAIIPLVLLFTIALPRFTPITVTVGPVIAVHRTVLGVTRARSGRLTDLMRITENAVYQRNYQPVYGIGLFFKDGTKITFGSTLTEEERKWLIGELHEMVLQLRTSKAAHS